MTQQRRVTPASIMMIQVILVSIKKLQPTGVPQQRWYKLHSAGVPAADTALLYTALSAYHWPA